MQFPFPFIDSLTIPTDAGPNDPRIVLTSDANGGVIEVYDNTGFLVGRWRSLGLDVMDPAGSSISLVPSSGATVLSLIPQSSGLHTFIRGQLFADLIGASDQPFAGLISPSISGASNTVSRIDVFGSDTGASLPPKINLAPNAGGGVNGYVDIPQDTAKTSDLRIGNISLGRGELSYVEATADDALAAGTEELFDICIINDLPVLSGRKYWIEGQASFSNVTTRTIFHLRYTEDGSTPTTASTILETAVFNTVAVGSSGGTGRVKGRYIPSSNLDLSVGLFIEAGAAITAFGANDQHGYISVTDVGK